MAYNTYRRSKVSRCGPSECETTKCPSCGRLECLCRPRFFPGQLLTEDDLNSLDHYIIEKNKLHNLHLHGWGVVCGLAVVCHECRGWVTIKKGYAIDPCGNDIIVCEDYSFNIIDLINECRRKLRHKSDCDPLLPPPGEGCKDIEEDWCLSISYEELESRPIAALHKDTCGCGNGNGNGGHRDNCDHNYKNGHRSGSHKAKGNQRVYGQTVDPCEPTRICEGYRVSVAPSSKDHNDSGCCSDSDPSRLKPGTLANKIICCNEEVSKLKDMAPKETSVSNMSDRDAHNACCSYHNKVRKFLTESTLTSCELIDQLNSITCPPIPPDGTVIEVGVYNNSIKAIVKKLSSLLDTYSIDCICLSLLPSCPPESDDNRVPLAKVTIKGDKVIRICNHSCRKQVISFPAISYWLSALLGNCIPDLIRKFCCSVRKDSFMVRTMGVFRSATFIYTPISLCGAISSIFGKIFSAAPIADMPDENAVRVDLRTMIGSNIEKVKAGLEKNFSKLTTKNLDDMPESVAALSKLYTPAAFDKDQPLIVYTKGDLVVGFDVPNEVERLKQEVSDLKVKVDKLSRG